ncbi:hypothetical protein M9H77_23948 [Catharanthus roseus]|uniref:Uncharacterized protein n=1 Tax=Catharanthus roseus TaxID=4058 RepID=A0ACC0AWH1_CATRO|nr:hypothetical protein M9H77_23948 [Catharanthus roseus]
MDIDLNKHGLLQTNELYQYILETSVYPRESEHLRDLRAATKTHPRSFFGTAPDEGQFLSLLLQTMNAKKTIEIGVFTGYSLLVTALALPHDGKITAIDIDEEAYKIGLPFIKKAGVEHKINFINSNAHKALDQLLQDENNRESFDFAFVDADKEGYEKYHEKLMKLVKIGGIIAYDNTLFYGTVAMAEDKVEDLRRKSIRKAIIEFNAFIAADQRIQISQAPLGDGYLLETSVYPRESEYLRELRAATESHFMSFMATAPDEGQFLSLLLQILNPKKTIEIGVYTGYSLLLTALALPEDAKITAIDIDEEAYNIGLPFIKKAGVEHKINFINSDAQKVLDQLLQDHNNEGSFEFAFVDADKGSYKKYHEKLMKLLKIGGIIIYDNTLWLGTVAMEEHNVPEEFGTRDIRRAILEFNKFIAADTRITAIAIDEEAYNIGLPFIKKAGVEHKINFIKSDAHKVLDELLRDVSNNTQEKLQELGTIAMAEEDVHEEFGMRELRRAIMEFNKFIEAGTRVQISQAPLGDGITICRRLQ